MFITDRGASAASLYSLLRLILQAQNLAGKQ